MLSYPGLLNIEFCIESMKNNPNALWAVAPNSPLLVQINVTSPFASISSKLMLLCLLHSTLFTPGILSKLSNCETDVDIALSVSCLATPPLKKLRLKYASCIAYFSANFSSASNILHIFSTSSKFIKSFNISSKFGRAPSFILGYISFNSIVIFSTACNVVSSLYASSFSGFLERYIPFSTEEIVVAIFEGSLYTNGFNPIDVLLVGSTRLYFILKLSHTSAIWDITS